MSAAISAADLAARALAAAAAPALDELRTRTVWNLAALRGVQDLTGPVVSVFEGAGPAAWAYRTGATMHARTQDDFFPLGRVHVGATVLPAVLAVGARDVLSALAGGYEVMCLVAGCYGGEAQSRGLRPTGVFGAIGAAAGAAIALGGDASDVAAAVSLAAAVSGGTNQAWADGSQEWMLQVGQACRIGVESALLAQAGLKAARRAVEGPTGWAAVFFADDGATRLASYVADSTSSVADVAIKPYPVSGIAQVPTELGVRARHSGLTHPTPVELAISPAELDYPGSRSRGPFSSRSDSLMSLTRCVAQGLTFGTVDFASLAGPPGVEEQAWLDQISLVGDETLDDGSGRLTVDGVEFRARAEDVLFPTWAQTCEGPEDVARSTEAPVDEVREFASVLAGRPSAQDLRSVWER
jgi:2-methylcitrate dehydratase PrpD